jgi:hypothetical protein
MASRFESIPEDFLIHLVETIPGLSAEPRLYQIELARMAWIGVTKTNQHSHFEHAMTFSSSDLALVFRRSNFVRINARVNFFTITPGWSQSKGYTKGYFLSHQLRVSIDQYLACSPWESTTRLLMADDKTLRSVPSAVASKDKAGVTTRAWVNARALNSVAVDLDALGRLKTELQTARDEYLRSDDAATHPGLASIERVVNMIGKVSRLSMTEAAGPGRMAHHYEEAKSGRLYPIGISLASAQTVVKDAALTGKWEYDIANCHYAIFAQMAEMSGHDCPAIGEYLKSKDDTRSAIATQAGITVRQAKTCLVALMYGARASSWHESAIPTEVGGDAAERLYRSPVFGALTTDIKMASDAILSSCASTPKGWKVNAFDKSIPGTAKKAQQMAHLLQGVEAKALQAVINRYPDDIVLVQHDGFVSRQKLDANEASEAIFTATGYRLLLEEKLLAADATGYFSSRWE